MTDHRVQAADEFTVEANDELAELITEVSDAADVLTGYADGHTLDIDRLSLKGTDAELAAWRGSREANAQWRVLLAQWRDHWRQAVDRRTGIPVHLRPKGLDLYGWEEPHRCDDEAVRLGVLWTQERGVPQLNPVHVDLIRVAQNTDAHPRLLGPTEALATIGPDGIVMAGHPLRTGTVNVPGVEPYAPEEPTWIKPQPDPPDPKHHIITPADRTRQINRNRDAGYTDPAGVTTIPKR